MDEAAEALDLIARCAEGDDDAWAEFFRRYGRFLDYMIRRALSSGGRIANPDDVADVRAEIVAWLVANDGRVLRTYRGESKVTSWIGVVVGRRARRIAQRGAGLRNKTVSLDALTADGEPRGMLSPPGCGDLAGVCVLPPAADEPDAGGARVVVVRVFGQAGHDAGVAAACMNSRSETHLIDTSRRAEPTLPNLSTAS